VTPDITALYRSLVSERLGGLSCNTCGASLATSRVVFAGDGTTHDELGLSAASRAALLAATERLLVVCPECGTSRETGVSLIRPPELPSLSRRDTTPWSPAAATAYRTNTAARVADARCPDCHSSLAGCRITERHGGTSFPEHRFDDERAAQLLAWTQFLSVECSSCARNVEL